MKLYGFIFDNGDGSGSIRWYTEKKMRDVLSEDYEYFDYVQMNEGSAAVTITVPEGMTPQELGIFSVDI